MPSLPLLIRTPRTASHGSANPEGLSPPKTPTRRKSPPPAPRKKNRRAPGAAIGTRATANLAFAFDSVTGSDPRTFSVSSCPSPGGAALAVIAIAVGAAMLLGLRGGP